MSCLIDVAFISLVALLEVLCARIFFFRFVNIGFVSEMFLNKGEDGAKLE